MSRLKPRLTMPLSTLQARDILGGLHFADMGRSGAAPLHDAVWIRHRHRNVVQTLSTMAPRIIPDDGKPSAAIEIALDQPMPDYDLDQIDQPTPRDVDGVLVSQGFRDLVDDARGILTDLLGA